MKSQDIAPGGSFLEQVNHSAIWLRQALPLQTNRIRFV